MDEYFEVYIKIHSTTSVVCLQAVLNKNYYHPDLRI